MLVICYPTNTNIECCHSYSLFFCVGKSNHPIVGKLILFCSEYDLTDSIYRGGHKQHYLENTKNRKLLHFLKLEVPLEFVLNSRKKNNLASLNVHNSI